MSVTETEFESSPDAYTVRLAGFAASPTAKPPVRSPDRS